MVQRESYIEQIRPFMDKDIVKVLTGIRRCGKSVMLELIQSDLLDSGVGKEQIFSINCESKSVDYIKDVDTVYEVIRDFVSHNNGKTYLFIDEIQELSGWETMINSCMIDFDVDIYITGSNAKMLSGELATYLSGRYVEFKIYPFSFAEVMKMLPDMSSTEVFKAYLEKGGMPFLYQLPLEGNTGMQYLEDIYSSIVLKDIIQRYKIRDVEQLKRVLLYLIANIGQPFSATSIIKYLKNEKRSLSSETLYNYVEYCQQCCLLHLVRREDVMGKRLLNFQEKIYLADHGLREAIYGNNMRDINLTLENIIYMELMRRRYDVSIGKAGEKEIDFVARRGADKIYIQVCYLLASQETIDREFGNLEMIADNYPKYVVSMDEINQSRNGIKHYNIREFLLMEEWH